MAEVASSEARISYSKYIILEERNSRTVQNGGRNAISFARTFNEPAQSHLDSANKPSGRSGRDCKMHRGTLAVETCRLPAKKQRVTLSSPPAPEQNSAASSREESENGFCAVSLTRRMTILTVETILELKNPLLRPVEDAPAEKLRTVV